jgi:hypothetical protein
MTTTQSREIRLGRLFVLLADNLVQDFDIVDLLHDLVTSCVDLFDVSAGGLMLADGGDQLRVLAASSEDTRLLELFELQNQQGPVWIVSTREHPSCRPRSPTSGGGGRRSRRNSSPAGSPRCTPFRSGCGSRSSVC